MAWCTVPPLYRLPTSQFVSHTEKQPGSSPTELKGESAKAGRSAGAAHSMHMPHEGGASIIACVESGVGMLLVAPMACDITGCRAGSDIFPMYRMPRLQSTDGPCFFGSAAQVVRVVL